ncbi:neuferricin [Nannospalax galili]|uniref:Neuferricin n=1 Tax=Nannospalax galili TaxID=1026970 RepID=A0A8C6WB69_NANGA|nr:neuferricin [Nannospalax galili]
MLRPCGRGLVLSLAVAAAAAVTVWLADWWGSRAGFRLFVPEDLARYRGGPGDPGLYLAVLGRVYDVSSGRRHYEPGAHYSGFAGRDASRAFVTGDYSEAGLVDDVSSLSFSEMLILHNWLSFYEKNYVFVGRVTGRFYRDNGLPTAELTKIEAMITKGLEANKQEQKDKQKFPPCNAEWSITKGSRFWCSQKSGGVNRDWIGVPRKLYKPGAKDPHCVCVRTTGPPSDQRDNPRHSNRGDLDDPNLEEYIGCPPLATTCSLPLLT